MTRPTWVTAWSVPLSGLTSVVGTSPSLHRYRVAVTFVPHASGPKLRLRFSNAHGGGTLRLRNGQVEPAGAADVTAVRPVTFDGEDEVSLAPGAEATSDAVDIPVVAGAGLRASFVVADARGPASGATSLGPAHGTTRATPLDTTRELSEVAINGSKYLVAADVASDASAIVAFGDSTTEAAGAGTAFSLVLADRLRALGGAPAGPVLNGGVSGDALRNGFADRVEREIGLLTGVGGAIVLIAINDIGGGRARHPPPALGELQAGIDRVVELLRGRDIRTWVSPVPPSGDAARPCTSVPHYSSPERVSLRRALNEWIRGRDYYDERVDFERALRDPRHPDRLAGGLSADGLHPNDAGHRRMAESIDLGAVTSAR